MSIKSICHRVDERKPPPKRDRPARNRAFKTPIERPLDWNNIEEIASAQDVEEFSFDAGHVVQMSKILQIELIDVHQAELNELATTYRHQSRQGVPSKDEAAAALRKLAKRSSKLARLTQPNQSLLDKTEGLIHNLNGVAFSRLAVELRSQLKLPYNADLSSLIYGQGCNWASLSEASAKAARHTNQGRYRSPTVKLCVQQLVDMFKGYTGKEPTYAPKRNTNYTTFAGSQAEQFVECFFRIVDPTLPPQTSSSALDKLLAYRRKASRSAI